MLLIQPLYSQTALQRIAYHLLLQSPAEPICLAKYLCCSSSWEPCILQLRLKCLVSACHKKGFEWNNAFCSITSFWGNSVQVTATLIDTACHYLFLLSVLKSAVICREEFLLSHLMQGPAYPGKCHSLMHASVIGIQVYSYNYCYNEGVYIQLFSWCSVPSFLCIILYTSLQPTIGLDKASNVLNGDQESQNQNFYRL